jgi:hypothetical protein
MTKGRVNIRAIVIGLHNWKFHSVSAAIAKPDIIAKGRSDNISFLFFR